MDLCISFKKIVIVILCSTILVSEGHIKAPICTTSTVQPAAGKAINVIDHCWRRNPNWYKKREQLATCSIGFAGKMTNNIRAERYEVTDPSDDPNCPRPGTLRFGVTLLKGKRWITFQKDTRIQLQKPLIIRSFTTIDGRGANVEIADGACFVIRDATNVIIHGLKFCNCKDQGQQSMVMGPDNKMEKLGHIDGDAISVISSSKIWIDHNTLSNSYDGLIDVVHGSTNITISNNIFKNHDKVMLLGHDDGHMGDKNMKVTIVYNSFNADCIQRMPRVRNGYTHVVNNLYRGWAKYAIGGSMNPRIKSEGNFFIAPTDRKHKEVTWRENDPNLSWKFHSVKDCFDNGANFTPSGMGGAKPKYTNQQRFKVSDCCSVKLLTNSAGALPPHMIVMSN